MMKTVRFEHEGVNYEFHMELRTHPVFKFKDPSFYCLMMYPEELAFSDMNNLFSFLKRKGIFELFVASIIYDEFIVNMRPESNMSFDDLKELYENEGV